MKADEAFAASLAQSESNVVEEEEDNILNATDQTTNQPAPPNESERERKERMFKERQEARRVANIVTSLNDSTVA